MANWKEPKSDYTAGSSVTPSIFNNLAENEKYLYDTRITTDKVQNASVKSTESTTRTNLVESETVKGAFGKIRKWFADLRALAFKDTIATVDIDNLSVTTAKLSSTAVTSAKIATGAVTSDKIGASAVLTDKINNYAVTADKISDAAVTSVKIANGAVNTVKIADLAVTTDKISNNAVTNEKINSVAASKVTGLATVATSGSYNDLSNKPTIPPGLTVVNNLTSTSTTSALSAYQGKVLNDRLNSLGFSSGACTLTRTGILNVGNTSTFTEYAPDGSTPTLQACNYYLKCGKYAMCHLELVGQSTTSGEQLAANTSFANVPYALRPRSGKSCSVVWQKTYSWSTVASGGTAHRTETTTYGTAVANINTSGYISVDSPVRYSTQTSAGKTSAGGNTVSGYLILEMFWRIN